MKTNNENNALLTIKVILSGIGIFAIAFLSIGVFYPFYAPIKQQQDIIEQLTKKNYAMRDQQENLRNSSEKNNIEKIESLDKDRELVLQEIHQHQIKIKDIHKKYTTKYARNIFIVIWIVTLAFIVIGSVMLSQMYSIYGWSFIIAGLLCIPYNFINAWLLTW